MFWDAEKKKLSTNADPLRDRFRFDDSDTQSDYSDTEENVHKLAKKLNQRVIEIHNKERGKTFHSYVQKKCGIFQEKMKQGEVLQSELNREFDRKKLTYEYMKEKGY